MGIQVDRRKWISHSRLFLNFFLMDDEGPYFSAVMSSPSDDGQCTDTDKDEESGDRVEQHTPEERTPPGKAPSPQDGSASDGANSDIDMNDSGHDESHSEESEQEDEEMRLRRKLLEKRAVATASSSTVESSSSNLRTVAGSEERGEKQEELSSSSAAKNASPKGKVDPLSDDEEMFSIQPRDAAHKERSHSARMHDERDRGRPPIDKARRRDKPREDRHRHKEKKREKHMRDRNRDKYKRDVETREIILREEEPAPIPQAEGLRYNSTRATEVDRARWRLLPQSQLPDFDTKDRVRHQSAKQPGVRERESGRLAGRITIPEQKLMSRSSNEKSHRERDKELDLKPEKHTKEAHRIRSPRKREASPLAQKPRSSKAEVPPKKAAVERYEESVKIEVTVSNSRTTEAKVIKKHKVTAIDFDADEVNDVVKPPVDSEEDDDATPISAHKASPTGPSKYSKFDSSPDEDVKPKPAEINAMDATISTATDSASPTGPSKYSKFDSSPDEDVKPKPAEINAMDATISTATDSEAESDIIMRTTDDELDKLENEDFDEEKLSQLSPDTRARVEAEQQRRLIAMLPIYYPGISGCRNVAEFECLNRIEEGTFGVVYRAKEKKTDEIVALKRLKMEKEKEGFPITSLREINMLLKAGNHPNIVNVREIVVGSTMDKIYLVMEYVEHDMKSLMDMMHSRGKHFTIGQVKTLLRQLLSGVAHMHDEWILHRDLKTSNLLLSHKGILKIGDFGLAREFGDPLKAYTPIVVTLWYRSPELLLGIKEYSTAVDMWSCGCIFAEFLRLKPLFPGKGELDQINKIFLELGTPNEKIWSGYSELPGPRKMKFDHHEYNQLWKKFPSNIVDKKGLDFLNELLRYDPEKRLTAHEALLHEWFNEDPQPTPPELFPTWPAKSELGKAVVKSPITKPPANAKDMQDEKLYRELKVEPPKKTVSTGFALKFDAVKFGD
uniref:cyclin-dependent kinase n=1 Tax=Ascaris lumbricoides TaxID=6252 RepID=A0A9J2Q8E8_ASCLU